VWVGSPKHLRTGIICVSVTGVEIMLRDSNMFRVGCCGFLMGDKRDWILSCDLFVSEGS
jgi:hypothetical protein